MTQTRTILARPPFEIDERAELVAVVREAAADVLRHPVDVAGVSYWADASLIAAAGIPTVLFGPNGDGATATSSGSACPAPSPAPRPSSRSPNGSADETDGNRPW
jgi:hypothetical protein